MGNRSYLCTSNVETLYPGRSDPEFDDKLQVIAGGSYTVPLLWMALFRPANMRSQRFEIDGESVLAQGPVVEKSVGLKQLAQAIPVVNRLFSTEGQVDEYAALLRSAIADAKGRYITIELDEIAALSDDDDGFYQKFTDALGSFEIERPIDADRTRFLEITEIEPHARFPPPRFLITGETATDDQIANHSRLLGAKWTMSLPWDP
ncbi:MAG TPA: hypothetical protein VGJ26_12835 [Pirellulales bacterium]|jgi:hypothetical protein